MQTIFADYVKKSHCLQLTSIQCNYLLDPYLTTTYLVFSLTSPVLTCKDVFKLVIMMPIAKYNENVHKIDFQ